jgi:hypothetical protein
VVRMKHHLIEKRAEEGGGGSNSRVRSESYGCNEGGIY